MVLKTDLLSQNSGDNVKILSLNVDICMIKLGLIVHGFVLDTSKSLSFIYRIMINDLLYSFKICNSFESFVEAEC